MSEPDDIDMLAAEYVLGTLDAAERTAVAARLRGDEALARAVAAWEERLAPLLDGVTPVPPPPGLYDAVAARLFGSGSLAADGGSVLLLRRRLARWRTAAGGLALVAASLAGWIVLRDVVAPGNLAAPRDAERLTAVLQRDAGAPAMVVEVDLRTRRLTVRPVAPPAPAGRAYELWMVDPTLGAPRSLGLVPGAGTARDSLAAFDDGVITGATYAVTLEDAGGSPTGRPTSAPILSGRLSPPRT